MFLQIKRRSLQEKPSWRQGCLSPGRLTNITLSARCIQLQKLACSFLLLLEMSRTGSLWETDVCFYEFGKRLLQSPNSCCFVEKSNGEEAGRAACVNSLRRESGRGTCLTFHLWPHWCQVGTTGERQAKAICALSSSQGKKSMFTQQMTRVRMEQRLSDVTWKISHIRVPAERP